MRLLEPHVSEETGSGKRKTLGGLVVLLVIAALLLYPPVVAFHSLGLESVFNFFAQDTFYYISVANRSTTGFYSFDGELPINGFHPLWQALLTALFNLYAVDHQATQLLMVFIVAVELTVAGYCLAGLAVYNMTGSRILGILVVPGVIHLLCLFAVLRGFSSPWNAMNGMESCLTALFGGVLLCLWSVALRERRNLLASHRFHWIVGFVLGLIVMARLDDVFLVVAFGLCYLVLRKQPLQDNITKALILAAPTVVFLACYLSFNYWRVGMLLPMSGVAKGGFALVDNLSQLADLLTTFSVAEGNRIHYWTRLVVHAAMWFPLMLALLFTTVIRSGRMSADDPEKELFLMALLVYVCLKALYNLIYVHASYQGNWYFVLSGQVLTFATLVLVAGIYNDITERLASARLYWVVFLAIVMALHVVAATHVFTRRGNNVYTFWKDAKEISSHLRTLNPGVKLVEFDDGFIGYSLNIPAIHGMRFLLDKQGYASWRKGRFLEYCYGRGFDTIASMQYIRPGRADVSSDDLRKILSIYDLRFENLDDYTFKMIFLHQETGTFFIRFQPKKLLKDGAS